MTKVPPSKDELERQKLALEIRELQRKWWKRPGYISALLPIMLASLTVLAGILSGFFDRERAKLQNEIAILRDEKSALLEAQSAIHKANEDAEKRLADLTATYQAFRRQVTQESQELFDATMAGQDPEMRRYIEKMLSSDRGTPTPAATATSPPEQKK